MERSGSDFSPYSQSLAAIALIDEKGALDFVLSGNFDVATRMLEDTWVALRGRTIGDSGTPPPSQIPGPQAPQTVTVAEGLTSPDVTRDLSTGEPEPVRVVGEIDPATGSLGDMFGFEPIPAVEPVDFGEALRGVAIAETAEDRKFLGNLKDFPEAIRGNALRL